MGLGLILAGFIFLIVPTVNIIDVMPDFIGYVLIFAGLARLKRIDAYLYKASHYALVLAGINAAKPVLLFLSLGGNETTRSSNIATATLIFLVLDILFGILFVKSLFDGFSDIGYQFGSSKGKKSKLVGRFAAKRRSILHGDSVLCRESSAYKRILEGKRLHPQKYVPMPYRSAVFSGVDGAYVFTVVFFILRSLLTLLPELATLDYTVGSDGMYTNAGSEGLRLVLMGLCFALGLAVGIIWYLVVAKYIKRVRKDKVFINDLESAYAARITDNPDIRRSIRYGSFAKLVFAALIFGGDLFIDKFDFIPDIIPAVLLMLAFIRFYKDLFIPPLSAVTAAINTALCGFCLYLQVSVSEYGEFYDEVLWQRELFKVMFPISKALFTALVVLLLISQLKYMKKCFKRAPVYSRGKLITGTCIVAASQIGSAVGYFTDIISDDLLHFPVQIGRAVFNANVYISFTSLVVYVVGMILFLGGIEIIQNKLAGKE